MKLLAKVNLIFVLVFGSGIAATALLARDYLYQNARQEIEERARLMMEATLATREYTSQDIKPLLIRRERANDVFLPETVPAFAATEVFRRIQRQNPDYSYKEATLNPTNLRDRAVDWEADIINIFRNHKDQKQVFGERNTPTGRSLYMARPITISDPACLECHDTAHRAPRAVVAQYGPNNGFGWQLDETVGAQIVSVPEMLVINTANRALTQITLELAALAVISLVLFDLLLVFTVIRPVRQLARTADEVSKGRLEVEQLAVRGNDEIANLAASFNRMLRSLQQAMKLLAAEDDRTARS